MMTLNDKDLLKRLEAVFVPDASTRTPIPRQRRVFIDAGMGAISAPPSAQAARALCIADSIARVAKWHGDQVFLTVPLRETGDSPAHLMAQIESEYPEWAFFQADTLDGYPTSLPLDAHDLYLTLCRARDRADDPIFQTRVAAFQAQIDGGAPHVIALWRLIVHVLIRHQQMTYADMGVVPDMWTTTHDALRYWRQISVQTLPVTLSDADSWCGMLWSRANEFAADEVIALVPNDDLKALQTWTAAARAAGWLPEAFRVTLIGVGAVTEEDSGALVDIPAGKTFLSLLKRLGSAAERHLYAQIEDYNLLLSYINLPCFQAKLGVAAWRGATLLHPTGDPFALNVNAVARPQTGGGVRLLSTWAHVESCMAVIVQHEWASAARFVSPVAASERALLDELVQFFDVLSETDAQRTPQHLAYYAHRLSDHYHFFVRTCHPARTENQSQRAAWVRVLHAFHHVFTIVLNLLGIIPTHHRSM
jgi:arginyl-tRNA synthetase